MLGDGPSHADEGSAVAKLRWSGLAGDLVAGLIGAMIGAALAAIPTIVPYARLEGRVRELEAENRQLHELLARDQPSPEEERAVLQDLLKGLQDDPELRDAFLQRVRERQDR
jgi:uncharacterized membrane protein YccC